MSTFGKLLKSYRERANLSQSELAVRAGLSASTISRVEQGERAPLRRRSQVLALARALALTQDETDILLSAADLAPSAATELALHPRDETLFKIAHELEALRNDANVSPAQVRFVEETLLLVLRGARAALPMADLTALPSGAPTCVPLADEIRYLDDLLGDLVASPPAGGDATGVGTLPFNVLYAAARSPHWELKRRLAEALPALCRVDVVRAMTLFETLREDPPDPEWRTDIRRRVIEATPALWPLAPDRVQTLLHPREGDEVYASLATLDALADIGDAALSEQIRAEVLEKIDESQRNAVMLYAQVLDRCGSMPDEALTLITRYLDDADRLVRICMARPLYRLLAARPAETLKLMRYVLRQEAGRPVEHQNVRRAIARHAYRLVDLLEGPFDQAALDLLYALVADEDVHIRRALCDALGVLAGRFPEVALDLIEKHLLQDQDRFVHERTWAALRTLMGQGSERAEELCAQLIEIV